MSYGSRQPGGAFGLPESRREDDDYDARKGSVRAARERLLAAQRGLTMSSSAERPRVVGLPRRPNQLVSQYSAQDSRQPQNQMPTIPSSSDSANAISPGPQWPLSNEADDDYVVDTRPQQRQQQRQQQRRPQERGPPPQRPPRPNYVPPMGEQSTSGELPLQRPSPPVATGSSENSYQEGEFLSPTTSSSRPLTTSSAASTASSLGSIPDFPVPMPAVQSVSRRNPNMGPPPSARRGPSSYYSQMSFVSPIAEESENARSHHGSFASSNVIPSNANDFYFDDDPSDIERAMASPGLSDDGRHSRGEDHDDQSGLVRKASLGRRTKPSLTTIKSGDSLRFEDRATSSKKKKSPKAVIAAATAGAAAGAFYADGTSSRDQSRSPGPPSSSLNSGTVLLDPSSSSSESVNSIKMFGVNPSDSNQPRSRSPLVPVDTTMQNQRDMDGEGIESPIHPLQMPTRQTSLADRVGSRRPPRLNVDAVREAEARGSLTSLPDLIRRATRLAANLDRGKTASRLGLDFWEAGAYEKKASATRRSGSLSDMLAAFPPPGDATPTGEKTPNRGISRWPSNLVLAETASQNEKDANASGRRRRCCGMPMWTFVTLLIVLLFLVAAAVVIPVVLIVLPKMKNSSSTNNSNATPSAPSATTQAGQCAASITCENGGVAVVGPNSSCSCLCTNGFTGKTCATNGDVGCTTINISGANNATIGSSIPRLLDDAKSNFSIALDAPLLMSLFSSSSLSCTSENALVTFNGLASRSIDHANIPILDVLAPTPSIASPATITPHPDAHELIRRQAIAATSDGIVYEASSSAYASGTATYSSAVPTSTPAVPVSSNSTALDFARIGVLVVLQASRKLDTAVSAQEALQNFLGNSESSSNANNVNLGNGFEIDLVDFAISLANGTTINGASSNSTSKYR